MPITHMNPSSSISTTTMGATVIAPSSGRRWARQKYAVSRASAVRTVMNVAVVWLRATALVVTPGLI
ncbi:MAG: hypothetical protein F4015_09595 [Acidimicrobiia bacterium]|nr:hypothetical protein [Acidimicrobiia bacterium]